ncbi:signal peptidase I [Clostridium swellfunianum]|uniref:signal peptidase I n=1 Tax=Clostridium swellfunianum TaxID=1367462 RepID=UPI0020304246|nr:signal peptidase I [Clostridium swellfunianum]MCM0649310.1 signal peptidase I [Clostridium swellfunianum]
MIKGGGIKNAAKSSFLIALMMAIYLLENLRAVSFNSSTVFIYAIKPAIWIVISCLIIFFSKIRPKAKIRLYSFLRWWAGYLAFIYIVITMGGGLIDGFGKSPYDLSFIGIIKNLFIVITTLLGREIIRARIVNKSSEKYLYFNIVTISIIFTFLSLPFNRISTLQGTQKIVQYIAQYVIPELSKNILACYLSYLGGSVVSIIYIGVIESFTWVFPILPNLKWITQAVIGGLVPIFSLMFIQFIYFSQIKGRKKNFEEKENPLGWIITATLSIGIMWFSFGVFPVSPAVIATGSMKPMIDPGDMVLVRKLKPDDIKVGDVIKFKSDNIYIFHRIISVKNDEQQVKYETKGDNNSTADRELVAIENIKGKVIGVIPKIGWPTLILKSRNDVPKEKVEF